MVLIAKTRFSESKLRLIFGIDFESRWANLGSPLEAPKFSNIQFFTIPFDTKRIGLGLAPEMSGFRIGWAKAGPRNWAGWARAEARPGEDRPKESGPSESKRSQDESKGNFSKAFLVEP